MKLEITITIETSNAAFTDNPNEIERVIDQAVDTVKLNKLRRWRDIEIGLKDVNGNTVGCVSCYGGGDDDSVLIDFS